MRRIAGKMGMLAAAAAFVLQFQVVNCAEKTSAETVIEQETQIDVLQSAMHSQLMQQIIWQEESSFC